MKYNGLLAYKSAYRLLYLAFSLLLCFRAEASVVAGTDFAPFVYPGDSIIWTLSDIQHYGVSGHTMRSKAEYSIDSRLFRNNETSHFAYCVTKNPSTLSKRYLENDEYMCVVQFAGEMEANTSFFSYRAQGLRPGTEFTVTVEFYLLNMVPEAMDLFGVEETPAVQFRACVNPDENGENATYGADGAVDVSTTEYQKKQTITLKGTYSADDPYLELNLLFAETGKAKGVAIGISNIKVEGTFDPHIYSSQGVEACENEQTLLTLDREYNVGDDDYSWQIFENGKWTEFSTAKNVMYNMEKNSVFRCVVAGVESNVLEVETIPCCQIEGKEASRKVLLWETFGHFKDEHTYVDSKGVESKTPAAWPNFRADVSYDLQGSRFDDGSGYKCPECAHAQSGDVHDGLYAIVVPSPMGFDGAAGKKVTWYKGVTSDHTSLVTGESNGGALFINVVENYTGPVFEAEFNDVCAGTQIFYEFWVANFSNNQYDPLVSFVLTDDKGEVLDEKENVVVKAKSGWTSISGKFLLDGEGTRNVKMQVLSVCDGYCTDANYWREGNDLILDDIKFMVCSPPSLDLYTDISEFTQDMKICSHTSFSLSTPVSTLLTSFFGEPKFLFQYSLDGGETWDNLGEVQDDFFTDEMNTSDAIFDNAEKMMFRVLSASEEVLNEFYFDPNAAQYGDNCRSYSVSEPITILFENAVDFGDTYYGSFCENDEVKLTAPTTNVELAYWGWKDEKGELPGAKLGQDESILTFVVTQHKSSEREIFTFTAYTAEGCQGIRNYVIDVREPVDFEYDEQLECGETKYVISESTPADAEFVWDYNGVITSGREFVYSAVDYAAAGDTKQHVFVSATGQGYCKNDNNGYELKFNPIPAAPTVAKNSLKYKVSLLPSAEEETYSLDGVATADAGLTLEWAEVAAADAEEPTEDWSEETPAVSQARDSVYYFYVRQKSDACASPSVKVEVAVVSAPTPSVIDTAVCVNSPLDLNDLVTPTSEEYEIRWYSDEVIPDGTGSKETPIVPTDQPIYRKYYVSQISKLEPFAESEAKKLEVVVVGVGLPDTTGNVYHYCAGDTHVELKANLVIDESKLLYADQIHWRFNGGEVSETATSVNTDVEVSTSYEYSVYQSLTLPTTTKEVCKGEALTWNVKVTAVSALSTNQVSYLRAESDANGNYTANLMAQSNNDAISGYDASMRLVWFEHDCETPIGDGLTAPTPQVDVTGEMGKDQYFYYCVKQSVNGCLSPGAEVEVVVNDAPKPNGNEYTYCRGEKAVAITTTPDMHIKPDAVYQLKWYGNGEKGDYTDLNLTGAEGPVPTTALRAGETGKSEYYYYVTQTEVVDGKLGAESNKTAIKVVVYDQPRITVDAALSQPVCKPTTVDLSRAVSLANAMDLNYQYTYYQDTSLTIPLANATVSVGGKYAVVAQFSLPVKNSTEPLTCVSSPAAIPVTIDTLSVAVANVTTCPDMEATFSVVAQTNALGGATYKWRGLTEADSTQTFIASSNFTTKKFVGAENGKSYLYSLQVAAGACRYQADTMKVTLGDAPVVGTLTIAESGISGSKSFSNATDIEFNSCGGALNVVAGYLDRTGNPISDYVWYEGGVEVAKGAELDLPANATSADKQYLLTFTNGCPATVSVTIHNRPIGFSPVSVAKLESCEGEAYEKTISPLLPPDATPAIAWYKNGVAVSSIGGVVLSDNNTKISIAQLAPSHSGYYGVVMTNNGCTASLLLDSLMVKPYIMAQERIDTIVPRHSDVVVGLKVTSPAAGVGVAYAWKESTGATSAANALQLNDVVADHAYTVDLSADGYCGVEAHVNVMVDALLRMTTSLKDTVCSGDSVVMTIDTTGTGLMRHDDWSRFLNVKATSNGTAADLTSKIVLKGDLLELAVAPLNSTTYEIHFHYGNQDTVANESVVVVPSGTNVVVSDPVKICAGDTAQIELSGLDPNYSVVKWKEDGTILTSDLSSTTIQVVPDYQGINHITFKAYYGFEVVNRYCQASRTDSAYVLVDEPLIGEITGDSVICEGFSTRLDASSYGATTYLWNKAGTSVGSGSSITQKLTRTTNYQLVMTRGNCRSEENYQVTVKSNPKILYLDSSDTKSRNVVLESGKGEAPFTYWLDDNENDRQFSSVFTDLPYRHHIMHVEDANGCVDQYGFTVVIPNFTVPAFFSPNGDGVRDRWVLEELSALYPDAEVFIYDRLGKLLAKFTGADEDGWDGTYNGHGMPSTDYWYVIVVKSIDREFKGHFTLIREK